LSTPPAQPAFAVPSVVALGKAHGVALDGTPVRTPAGAAIAVPTRAFAQALAEEWQGVVPKGKFAKIDFARVPLTRIVGTAIDRIAPQRDAIVDALLAFAETDLVCYRVEQPRDLAARQNAHWQPLLDWLAHAFGARLETHLAVVGPPQPDASLKALRKALEAANDFELAGLGVAVDAAGSLVIGLALAQGRIDAAQAFAAAELDASYQAERWGEDPVLAAKHAAIRGDLAVCERFFALARG
jgi:chaperone required for assembly of F1-ATPase